MVRGKPSVQLYDDVEANLTGAFNGRSNSALLAIELQEESKQSEEKSPDELGEHIVDQLRAAYDELLNAPLPDHLQKLLTDLCKAEGRS